MIIWATARSRISVHQSNEKNIYLTNCFTNFLRENRSLRKINWKGFLKGFLLKIVDFLVRKDLSTPRIDEMSNAHAKNNRQEQINVESHSDKHQQITQIQLNHVNNAED